MSERSARAFVSVSSQRTMTGWTMWLDDEVAWCDSGRKPDATTVLAALDKCWTAQVRAGYTERPVLLIDTASHKVSALLLEWSEWATTWAALASLRSQWEVVWVWSESWRRSCNVGVRSENTGKVSALAAKYGGQGTVADIEIARSVCVGVAWLLAGCYLPDTSTHSGKRRI